MLLFTACSPPVIDAVTPTSLPSPTPVPVTPILSTPDFATPETHVAHAVEKVTLATRIEPDGTPVDERSSIPELPEMIYLCVLMREVEAGSRFRAYWFQNNQVVGQSDVTVQDTTSDRQWVALRYRPIARLNPVTEHAVELRINDTVVDRYLFRVGVGSAEDAIAAAAFTSGFDEIGNPIDPRTVFSVDDTELTLKVRVSNQVDPAGMTFTTLWFRGDAQIAQIYPEHVDGDPRRMDFTFVPSTRLSPGEYRVMLLLNGTQVRSVRFSVTVEPVQQQPPTATPTPVPTETPTPEPTATPEPSPTPQPTATSTASPTATQQPRPSDARIRDVVIATSINPNTRAPADGPVFDIDRPAGSVTGLWIAVAVENVLPPDVIEVVVTLNDAPYARFDLPHGAVQSGWLSTEMQFNVPTGQSSYTYTVSLRLNGQRTLDATFLIRGV